MSRTYAYVVHDAVVQVFDSSTKSQRLELLGIFQRLAAEPHQTGDYVQTSAEGRQMQVKRFGQWYISFWADHAAAELRIVGLRKLPL
jgi:hypothetical protein